MSWIGPFVVKDLRYVVDKCKPEKDVCYVYGDVEDAQSIADLLNAQAEHEAAEKPVGAPVYFDKDGEVVVVKDRDG